MSQSELSRQTGIPTSTISDWKKKKMNPQSDKLVVICNALNYSLSDLLLDGDDESENNDFSVDEKYLLQVYRKSDNSGKIRMIKYFSLYDSVKPNGKRNISIIQDVDGNNIVVINDIIFKGKRSINWNDVEKYLKEHVGEFYSVVDTNDIIYLGSDFPSEYCGSVYTKKLKGTLAKAKANAVQGLPEIIEIAKSKVWEENKKGKHSRNAKNGWYKYDTRFALPVYDDEGEIDRYNIFKARLIIRKASSQKMYLYDITEIKKETSKSCQE